MRRAMPQTVAIEAPTKSFAFRTQLRAPFFIRTPGPPPFSAMNSTSAASFWLALFDLRPPVFQFRALILNKRFFEPVHAGFGARFALDVEGRDRLVKRLNLFGNFGDRQGGLFQPHARAATVLSDELDAGGFEGATDGGRRVARSSRIRLGARDRVAVNAGAVGKIANRPIQ